MLILAHRGLVSPARPENTLAAVDAALAAGADGVEVDLRLTADGVLALSHDADLRRVAGLADAVADLPFEPLRERVLEVGGVHLASAEQVLVAAVGRRVVLEVKQPPPGPGAAERTATAVCRLLAGLQRDGLPLDVTVSSFSAELVRRVAAQAPAATRTALLGMPLARPTSLIRQALDAGHDEIHPHVSSLLAAPDGVRLAHTVGLAVVPWTVNRRRDIRRLARLGCHAVITDAPVDARAVLATAGSTA